MNLVRIELALWTIAAAAATAAALSWSTALLPPGTGTTSPAKAPALPRAVDVEALADAANTIIDGNPFRLTRRPAATPFGGDAPPAQPSEAPPERPRLRLAGIIGGPPWHAILEGVPGRAAATVVSKGDVMHDMRITSISRTTVIIQASDTTWTLTLDRPWRE